MPIIPLFLSYTEIAKNILECHKKRGYVLAVIPVGCVEQHGPNLPIETDSLIAEGISRSIVASIIDRKHWAYTFPVLHYSPTRSNSGFPGTISINENCFRSYIKQLCKAFLNTDFDAVIIVSGHGPADTFLREISFRFVNDQFKSSSSSLRPIIVISTAEKSAIYEKIFNHKAGKHADWREALLLYGVLGKSYFTRAKIKAMRKFQRNNMFYNLKTNIVGIPLEYRSTSGVIGDPFPFIANEWHVKGKKAQKLMIKEIVKQILKDIKTAKKCCEKLKQ